MFWKTSEHTEEEVKLHWGGGEASGYSVRKFVFYALSTIAGREISDFAPGLIYGIALMRKTRNADRRGL